MRITPRVCTSVLSFVIALIANYKEGEQQDAAAFYIGLIRNLIDLQKTMERLALAMQIARCEKIISYTAQWKSA